jgi:3D-(3,5/4)-trihydroxycyclohexane-1,2-dione acylhydrolase (decyclizing)
MKTIRLTAAAAIVRFLREQYIERDGVEHRLIHGVFGIFGHGNVTGLGQALEEHGGTGLPFFQPKNEQGMVHTAVAFSKTLNRLGTYACTTSVGPGATNMITGAATATINRIPVLLLPGDIFAGRGPNPVLQQLEHPGSMDVSVNDCFRPVSRFWDRINRPEQLIQSLPEAMRVLADPVETGAVTLCLPQDVQAESFDFPVSLFAKKVHRVRRPVCDAQDLQEAVAALKAAERPLILAGGGVKYSEAEGALQALVEQCGIPVGVTQAGKGSLRESHPQCMGGIGVTGTPAANVLAEQADVVVAVGTRLSDFTTASKTQFKREGVRFIHLNIGSFDAHKHNALALIGDARVGLEALAAALEGHRVSRPYAEEIATVGTAWESEREEIVRARGGELLSQAEVIRILNEYTDANATVVHAAGGIPGDIHKLWRSHGNTDYHSEYGYSCMGYEIAGALGVKLAAPDREVYAFLGDGSFLMLSNELLTAVQEGRKITVVLNDNQAFGCIHNLQRGSGGRSFGNEFRHRAGDRLEGAPLGVDFVKLAEGLGAWAVQARTEAEVKAALADARSQDGCCLIHIPVDPDVGVPGHSWWDVPIAAVSEIPSVNEAFEARADNLRDQVLHYDGE